MALDNILSENMMQILAGLGVLAGVALATFRKYGMTGSEVRVPPAGEQFAEGARIIAASVDRLGETLARDQEKFRDAFYKMHDVHAETRTIIDQQGRARRR